MKNYLKVMLKKGLEAALKLKGYEIVPLSRSDYLPMAETLEAAQNQRQNVCEYLEKLWDQKGCTEKVILSMKKACDLSRCQRICEIGPGTGRYLEKLQALCSCQYYEFYETAEDWAAWLQKQYAPKVIRQPADGRTLQRTPDSSRDLIHAHGVFVYLSFLHAFEYFEEMVRSCAQDGYIVFDFYSDEHFTLGTIKHWLQFSERYPVVLPYNRVLEYFKNSGFELISQFENKHGHSFSHYVVLQKTRVVTS